MYPLTLNQAALDALRKFRAEVADNRRQLEAFAAADAAAAEPLFTNGAKHALARQDRLLDAIDVIVNAHMMPFGSIDVNGVWISL